MNKTKNNYLKSIKHLIIYLVRTSLKYIVNFKNFNSNDGRQNLSFRMDKILKKSTCIWRISGAVENERERET